MKNHPICNPTLPSFKATLPRLCLAFGGFLLTSPLLAADYYWDANGTGNGTGGTGTWGAANTWRDSSATGTLGNWVDGNNAVFGGTVGTTTINANVNVTGITTTVSQIFAAASTGVINLGTGNIINVGGTASNFDSVLAGSFTISGAGSTTGVRIAGNNANVTGTIVNLTLANNGGLLLAPNANAFGGSSSTLKITSGAVNLGQIDIVTGVGISYNTGATELNGGKLRARVGASTWNGPVTLTANSTIESRGAAGVGVTLTNTVDLGGSNLALDAFAGSVGMTFNGVMSGTGTLNKNGPATAVLNGNNTLTGAVNINAGRLDLNGTNASNVSVAAAGTLGGEGSTTGSVTFASGSKFAFNPNTPAAFTAASVNASAGPVTVVSTSTPPNATGIPVLTATGGISGPLSNFVFTGRGSLSFNDNTTPTQLLLDYSPASMVWKGDDSTNPSFWDLNTSNWINGAVADKYFDFDNVTFDDTASSFLLAVQASGVSPGSMTFTNSTNDYTLSGAAIGGIASLIKSGAAALNIQNNNTFSGGTTISAGTVNVTTASGLGTGAVSVATGSTLNLTSATATDVTYTGLANSLSGGGTVNLAMGVGTGARPLAGNCTGFTGSLNLTGAVGAGKLNLIGIPAAAATINAQANTTVFVTGAINELAALTLGGGDTGESLGQLRLDSGATWSGPVTLAGDITGLNDGTIGSNTGTGTVSGSIGESGGARALIKTGGGGIVLAGANTYTGATSVLGGALILGNTQALGTGTAGVTVASGARLSLSNGITITGRSATIAGGGGDFNGALQAQAGAAATWDGPVSLNSADARIGAGVGGTLTISGPIQDGTANAINFGSGVNGTGTVIVATPAGGNTYTGPTNLIRGTVMLGAANSLPATTTLDVDNSTANEACIFDLNGFNQTVAGLKRGNVTGGAATLTNSSATAAALTVNQSVTTIYDGAVNGNLALVKDGTGILNLAGAIAYTGNTTITAGTLGFSQTGLSDTSTVTIAAGAVAALNFTGNDRVGSLVINGAVLPDGVYTNTSHGGIYASYITGPGALQVGEIGFVPWIAGFPTLTGNDALPTADPDGDGVANLLEFVLGGIPNVSDSSVLPTVATTPDGLNLVLTLKRSDDSQVDTTLVLQIGTDLATWPPSAEITLGPVGDNSGTLPGEVTYSVEENADLPDDIVITIPNAAEQRKFLRIKATKP